MEQRDFFVSYAGEDEAWARWIANTLKSNGYTVYAQMLDIRPGDNFIEKMNEFLGNSRNFIAVWSKTYSESLFCMAELQAAFHEKVKGRLNSLLPVRIDHHPVELLYAGLVRVDLSDMSTASEVKLMDAVRYVVPRPKIPTITVPDVFISYHVSKDTSAFVRNLANKLEQKGIPCWYAPRNTKPSGFGFATSILNALNNCKIFLLLLDEGANGPGFVYNETLMAFHIYKDNKKRPLLLPFKVGDFQIVPELYFYLVPFHIIDGGHSLKNTDMEKLLGAVDDALNTFK